MPVYYFELNVIILANLIQLFIKLQSILGNVGGQYRNLLPRHEWINAFNFAGPSRTLCLNGLRLLAVGSKLLRYFLYRISLRL